MSGFPKDKITVGRTYKSPDGRLWYIQDLQGQKVTVTEVGSVDQIEISLGRFAARVACEVPNV